MRRTDFHGLYRVFFRTALKAGNRDVLNAQFESLYGVDFDEYINRLYGEE